MVAIILILRGGCHFFFALFCRKTENGYICTIIDKEMQTL